MDRDTKSKPLTIVTDPHGMHAESIRRLRTNLLFVDVTTGKHSFVVTSAMPGEGKTTTVVNLAMALADTGARVLLVDGDLRNPSVARSMGLEGGVGLTTILIGAATVDDVVQQWRDTSLYVLPAGQVPPNPSEILGSEPMETLFDHLTKEFDYVLVDSPPVLPVIDAVVINKLVGGLALRRRRRPHPQARPGSRAEVADDGRRDTGRVRAQHGVGRIERPVSLRVLPLRGGVVGDPSRPQGRQQAGKGQLVTVRAIRRSSKRCATSVSTNSSTSARMDSGSARTS